jgi:hypothetical protein
MGLVCLGRFASGQLIELRDLPKGHLNADTLFILTTVDRKDALRALILTWGVPHCRSKHAGQREEPAGGARPGW